MQKIREITGGRFKKLTLDVLIITLSLGLVYLIFYIAKVGCPIKFLTGISCMGCGMTRAYICLFHLDFGGAFKYHPLFFLPPFLALLLIFEEKISRRVFRILMFTMIAAFSIIYIIRLLDGKDDVVVFEPENGAIFRMLRLLKN